MLSNWILSRRGVDPIRLGKVRNSEPTTIEILDCCACVVRLHCYWYRVCMLPCVSAYLLINQVLPALLGINAVAINSALWSTLGVPPLDVLARLKERQHSEDTGLAG